MKKILINAEPWQTRIAILQDQVLQNLYLSSHAAKTLERTYIKGKIIKILPGIQTAFVDIGQERSGFLHISEIDRELAIQRMTGGSDEVESEPRTDYVPRRELDISKIFHEGEEVLVQVSKEPIHEKGAKLTTCFTLPGRFLVLMPNIPRIGISKKIEDQEERKRLKELVAASLPEGMGAIIRTPSEGQSEADIKQDLSYLVKTWEHIQQTYAQAAPATQIYQDIELYLQAVRDNLDHDVEAIICDNAEIHNTIYKFVKNNASDHAFKVQLHTGKPTLFEKYNVETQIEEALNKKVHLKSGGSIIVETAESMTVVDVNTGKYTGSSNLEETIFKINLEAAEEIVRQLRLRNIGGLIVIDFIDMSVSSHKQKLFKTLEKMLKERDKFQSVVLRVSEFGLVQMTRKRSGKTLMQQMMVTCYPCKGLGMVRSVPTEAFMALRKLREELSISKNTGSFTFEIGKPLFDYISTTEYNAILSMEKEYKRIITLVVSD